MSISSSKPLILYAAPSPSGRKVSILLEELKIAYPDAGVDYDVHKLSFSERDQKSPWYTQINPNGRSPALIHQKPNGESFKVFESAAIQLYVAQHFDKDFKFSCPLGSEEQSEVIQWVLWGHAGVGPFQGQFAHFSRYTPEKIPYAIERYRDETKRLYSVAETRLTGRDWLAGTGPQGAYTIADINIYPWLVI